MDRFVEAQTALLAAAYEAQLRSATVELADRLRQALEEHVSGLIEALEMKLDLHELQAKHERLLNRIGS